MQRWRLEATMRIAIAIVWLAAGCASAQRIEEGAMRHDAEARTAEAQGDYARAQKERDAAWKQYRKAEARRYGYSYYW
jgi:hypothetical protein